MARKNRSKNTPGTRDALPSLTLGLRSRPSLMELEDLRTFDFEPATRPPRRTDGGYASVVASTPQTNKKAPSKVPYQISFSAPAETLVCVRRSRRKEVLFAKKKTGRRGQKKARWSKWSTIKC